MADIEATSQTHGRAAESPKRLVVGYGTLLHRASLGNTIGSGAAEARSMRPVIVVGFRRLFNLRPDHYETSSVFDVPDVENAAMNVEPAAEATLNGLAFAVSPDELADLDRRERYYRRLEAQLLDFTTGEPLGAGEIYASEPDERWIERDPERLMPLWRDVEWARGGAYAVGAAFGSYFDESTYLADGTTLVAERYRGVLDPPPARG